MSGKSLRKKFCKGVLIAAAATAGGVFSPAVLRAGAAQDGDGAQAAGADAAEANMRRVVGALLDGRPAPAMRNVVPLVKKHPNFRPGRLIYADLLAARAHQKTLMAFPGVLKKTRVRGLVEETKARLLYRAPADGLLPGAILRLSRLHRHALVLDAERSRLYLFENKDGVPRLSADYYISIGNGGVGKTMEGDEKTPLGVYHPTSHLEDDKLPELYGAGAYPLNYPNRWDRLNDRDGSGIWLHGTPRTVYSRPPRDSRGCVVLSNQLLTDLSPYITVGGTPVILAALTRWLPSAAWRTRRDRLSDAIRRWQRDWQSLDVERYLGHYSREYRDGGGNYEQMAAVARKNAKKKTFVEVEIKNLDLFEYPGEKGVAVAVFDQGYRSNNYNLSYRKQQFWKYVDGRWLIIFEDRAETAPPV